MPAPIYSIQDEERADVVYLRMSLLTTVDVMRSFGKYQYAPGLDEMVRWCECLTECRLGGAEL